MSEQELNTKAQLFADYLKEHEITVFQTEPIDDELKTVVFRSNIQASGQNLTTLVILDNSIYGILRVIIGAKVVNDENRAAVLDFINSLNAQYKVSKYYVVEDGTIVMDSCILLDDQPQNIGMIYTVIGVLVRHLETYYPQVMAKVWGK